METLSIRTDFPSVPSADFSVLPSPSTFFALSTANAVSYASPTFDQYPISATDYHEHFLPAPAHEAESDRAILSCSTLSSSSSSSASDHHSLVADTPSPASSFPSTPTGSPVPQHLVVDKSAGPPMNKQVDPAAGYEVFEQFIPSQHPPHSQFDCALDFNGSNLPPPPSHHHAGIDFAQPPPRHAQQLHAYAPHVQSQQQQQAQFFGGLVYVNGVPQVQQYAAAQPVPYSIGPLGRGNIAYAMPQVAPGPAAIETPHGTYYFVPNVNAAATAAVAAPAPSPPPLHHANPAVNHEPVQLPSPPRVEEPALTESSNPYSGFVQLPNGLTAGVAIAQASTAVRSASGATATVVVGDQKIRLPVGQGKRGSTKRPAKKDQLKRFICPHPGCGRAFARNFNMQSHHKSHLGIREFSCPHCPKKFSRRHDRARHCSAVHNSRVDRDGNVTVGGRNTSSSSSASTRSESDDEEGDYDDSLDEDKNFQLVDYAG